MTIMMYNSDKNGFYEVNFAVINDLGIKIMR